MNVTPLPARRVAECWKSLPTRHRHHLARREPLVEILLDCVEGSTGASEAHVAVRANEVLRSILHTEACKCLTTFVDQRSGLRVASEMFES